MNKQGKNGKRKIVMNLTEKQKAEVEHFLIGKDVSAYGLFGQVYRTRGFLEVVYLSVKEMLEMQDAFVKAKIIKRPLQG